MKIIQMTYLFSSFLIVLLGVDSVAKNKNYPVGLYLPSADYASEAAPDVDKDLSVNKSLISLSLNCSNFLKAGEQNSKIGKSNRTEILAELIADPL